jgi:hypothetical protein
MGNYQVRFYGLVTTDSISTQVPVSDNKALNPDLNSSADSGIVSAAKALYTACVILELE